jgi:tartrate dehydrogenase/decarboxylase / D-malate dehydrogenase
MKTYNIAAIPGDGIGSEVIAAGIEALQSLADRDGSFGLHFEHFDWGSDYYLEHGEMMPSRFSVDVRTDTWVCPRYRRAGHSQSDRHIPDGSDDAATSR